LTLVIDMENIKLIKVPAEMLATLADSLDLYRNMMVKPLGPLDPSSDHYLNLKELARSIREEHELP
jgi:hypothetical protein